MKFYSKAQQAIHQSDSTYTSQSQFRTETQAPILTQSEAGFQDQLA